jgi:Carboxypeptidase regulatory-like domain
MKTFRLVLFIFLVLNFNQIIKAQADCVFDFRLYVRDSNGKSIDDANIKMNLVDFYFNSQHKIYSAWTLLGVGSKYNSILKVEAKGFNKFQKEFELKCGFYAYDLRLSEKKTNEPASFEELARISGKVVDANNAVIAETRVFLSDVSGKVRETVSNENGYYDFIIPSGNYSLEFVGTNGFEPKKFKDYKILKGNNYLNVILEAKSCNNPSIRCTILTTTPTKTKLTGSVYDAYGALIIGAKITAINERGEKFETKTNGDGIYNLELPYHQYNGKFDFRLAKYELIVEKESFEKTIIKDFKFAPSYTGKVNLDFAMDVFVNINTITIQTDKNNKEEK